MKQYADNRIAGFSLIEVIVGIAVLGLVTVPLCASLVLSVRLNMHSRDLMNAQLAASSAIEILMAEGIDADISDLPVEKTVVEKESWNQVTVVGTVNGQTVELTTAIRK